MNTPNSSIKTPVLYPIQQRYTQILTENKKPDSLFTIGAKPEPANITSEIVQLILSEAVSMRASDIHIEPRHNNITLIRYRIDGKLRDVLEVKEPEIHIVPRIKILAEIPTDPGSSKKSWDGRFTVDISNQNYDFRVSTLPTVLGDKIAIRILNKNSEMINLKKIGLRQNAYTTLETICNRKQGLIVVSGPTGAGKTTTLYSMLQRLHTPEVNIVTLENPVEYQFDGINQCDVNKKNGETFASALKVTLRQDPDIILIGEIRDLESAEIAIRASITGHLVLTSLHANSALGSVARLINMGLERHMVSYALTGAVSQHLLPKICEECRVPQRIDPDFFNKLCRQSGIDPNALLNPYNKTRDSSIQYLTDSKPAEIVLYKGAGCSKCNKTGYSGRIGVFEVVRFTEDLREAIISNASIAELENIAATKGYQSLAQDALQKAINGIVNFEDVYPILLDRT